MSVKGNIVDFDKAKAASNRPRRSSTAPAQNGRSSRKTASSQQKTGARRAQPESQRGKAAGQRSTTTSQRSKSASQRSASTSQRSRATSQRDKSTAQRSTGSASRRRGTSPVPTASRRSAAASTRKQDSARQSRSTEAASSKRRTENERTQSRKPASDQRVSMAEKARHDMRKHKAERDFNRTVRQDAPAQTETSRAAVYRTQMGSSHKRASRMQQSASTHTVGFKLPFGLTFDWGKPYIMIPAAVVLCLVLGVSFLYPAAQQYYCAMRGEAQLQAEYDALVARNGAIQKEVDSLSTPSGIEARARSEYGWVMQGENAVLVTGLDSSENADSYTVAVPEGSVPAPSTWYSAPLDAFFGYNR